MRKLVDWARHWARSNHSSPSHRLQGVVPRVEELENRLVPSTFTVANFGSPKAQGGIGLYLNDGSASNTWVNIAPGATANVAVVDAQGDVLAEFLPGAGVNNPGLQLLRHGASTWTLLTSDVTTQGNDIDEGLAIAIAVNSSGNPVIAASFVSGNGFIGGVQETTDGVNWRLLSPAPLSTTTATVSAGLDVDENGDVVAQFGGTIPGIQYFNAVNGIWTQISNTRSGGGFTAGEYLAVRIDAQGDVAAAFPTSSVGPSLQFLSHADAIAGNSSNWQLLSNQVPESFSIGDNGAVVATFAVANGSDNGFSIIIYKNGPGSGVGLDQNFNDNPVRIDKDGNVVEYTNTPSATASAGLYFLASGNGPGQWTQMSFDSKDGGLEFANDDAFEVGSK